MDPPMSDRHEPRVLIVDDEPNLRESLREYLALEGFTCSLAEDGPSALQALSREVFDAVVLDLRLPGMDGLAVLEALRAQGPNLPVIMMSAHGQIPDAVGAMRLGAVDFLVKPFNPEELSVRLERAVSEGRLMRLAELGLKLSTVEGGEHGSIWLGDSPAMRSVSALVSKGAPSDITVLITGESGTGKEVVAREIHRLSPRASGPFVPVNLSALPDSLVESELFGHERGAFTGAESRKAGYFELASGGTLFLDELGEVSPAVQVKLLRVIQDRVVTRVGGTRPLPVDVRLVAATNRDLEAAVKAGTFREDLYFRVNVLRVRLPPLRERAGDIATLAGLFAARFARKAGRPIPEISGEALRSLEAYPFPGNVRELENAIERAVLLSDSTQLTLGDFSFLRDAARAETAALPGSVASADLAEPGAPGPASDPARAAGPGFAAGPATAEGQATGAAELVSIKDAERAAIASALARTGGHRERTAAVLGISRRTLLTKMREYNL